MGVKKDLEAVRTTLNEAMKATDVAKAKQGCFDGNQAMNKAIMTYERKRQKTTVPLRTVRECVKKIDELYSARGWPYGVMAWVDKAITAAKTAHKSVNDA